MNPVNSVDDLTASVPDSWRTRSSAPPRHRAVRGTTEPGDAWHVWGWVNISAAAIIATLALVVMAPPAQLGVLVLCAGDLVFGALCLVIAELKKMNAR